MGCFINVCGRRLRNLSEEFLFYFGCHLIVTYAIISAPLVFQTHEENLFGILLILFLNISTLMVMISGGTRLRLRDLIKDVQGIVNDSHYEHFAKASYDIDYVVEYMGFSGTALSYI